MKEEIDDATFDALTSFFNQYDVIETTGSKGTTRTGTDGEELLVASEQLLTETEELLALYPHPINKHNDTVTDSSPKSSEEEDKAIVTPKGRLSDDLRQAVRNAQAAKRRHRYRQQLKEERESLKAQTTQLSGQLLKLQKARAQLKAKQAENLAFGAWRAIAVRQLEQRLQAEKRQKLLREEVAGRARMIHRMNILLQERLQNRETNPINSLEWMKTVREADGSELVKSMMAEFDTQYAQIDEVSRGLEFKTSIPMSHNLTKKWQDGVLYFDSADRMEYPYGFERTEEVLTTLFMSDDEVNWESIQVQGIKDTFAMKYRTSYQVSPGRYSSFVVYGATKKYRAKDRVVFLCRCFSEGCDEFEGFHSDETLWLVVRPSADSLNTTILECYSRLIPMHFSSAPSCNENLDNFVKIVAEWGKQESNKMMELMERLLISK